MIHFWLSIGLALVTTLVGTPFLREYLKRSGLVGIDQQKPDKPIIPSSGGIVVLFSFIFSVTFFLGINSLLNNPVHVSNELVLAAVSSVSIIALVGLVDDVNLRRLSNKDKLRDGLDQFTKMMLVLPAAFPLIAVGAGAWEMHFPLIGIIDWGLIYPLVLLPIGLLFVSNSVNMLAGCNGLSAGLASVNGAALGLLSYSQSNIEASLIAFGISAASIGFLYYNKFEASILPGDSFTYLAGGALFSAIVLGNLEIFGVLLFVPWIIEFFLKARSRFNARSWGQIQPDGTLQPFTDKNYSLTHPLMRKGLNEPEITMVLVGFQLFWSALLLLVFT